jgi:hypothetical protein
MKTQVVPFKDAIALSGEHMDEKRLQERFDQIEIVRIFEQLSECRSLIRNGIIPGCHQFAPEETAELTQALELGASAIDTYLKTYKITVEIVKRGKDEKR